MFDLVFIALIYLSGNGSYSMEAFPNQTPITMEDCQSALPDIIKNVQEAHPEIKVAGWCVPEKWPFPPAKQPKGSI